MNAAELTALYNAPAYTRPTPPTASRSPLPLDWDDLLEVLFPEPLEGVQVQGDVMVLPVHGATGCHPVGDGVNVIPDNPTGNRHILTGAGDGVAWTDYATLGSTFGHRLGALTVPPRTVGILVHTGHHEPLYIAPGSYELHRQMLGTGARTRPAERYRTPRWLPTFGRGDGSAVFMGHRYWDSGC